MEFELQRRARFWPIAALASVAFLGIGVAAPVTSLDSRLHLAPCVVGKAKLPARCGTLDVFEDRAAQSGRTIPLKLVVVAAKTPSGRAMFWNPGGPGASAVEQAPFIVDGVFAKPFVTLRDRYDLVFVDVRGTGGSAPLNCSLFTPNHAAPYFAKLWPDAPLRACRTASAKKANLDLYTTDITADDLEDVRAALKFDQVVLFGGSYGTMLYLDYLRRHPAHVESAVLEGVAPPGVLVIPLDDAQGAKLATSRVIAACASDPACHRHFPDFGAHAAALQHRFDRGPLSIRIRNLATKRLETVALSKEVFADRLRQAMYSTEGAALVPVILEHAYRGDYEPLGWLIQQITMSFGEDAMGLNLSVTCAEDIPFITEADIARTSAGTFQGDTRVRAQQHACAIWNVRPVARAFNQPVRSDAPILMISGADDPASPPDLGRAALRYLPNARQILIPHAAHEIELACADRLIVEFVRARSAKKLDTAACAASFHRPPFLTKPPPLR
jgi:pimeloyl-ACP methyl ester carboxylesterase